MLCYCYKQEKQVVIKCVKLFPLVAFLYAILWNLFIKCEEEGYGN